MSEMRKSLVFYLTYFPEMQQAYEDEVSFPNVDPAKVKSVGKAANIEAENLLSSCTKDWFNRLNSSKVASFKHSRQATVQRNWEIQIDVRPRGQKISAPLKRKVGLSLQRDELIPWVWSRGGVTIEERIRLLLPPEVKSFGSKKYGWTGGSIAISPVKIPWDSAKDFRLDAENIITETRRSLAVISPKFIEALLKL